MRGLRLRLVDMLVLAAGILAGCVEARTSLGTLTLRPYHNIQQTLDSYGVQEGRLVSGAVDVAVDPDDCARGVINPGTMLVLCPKELKDQPPLEVGGRLVRWSGIGGDLVTELAADGRKLRVDGYLGVGRGTRAVHVTLRLYPGQPWDELREHPVLYAVAAVTSGMEGEPPPEEEPGL